MTHDPLCPNIPCNCEPDYYGHEFSCAKTCYCELLAKARADERSKFSGEYREGIDPIPANAIRIWREAGWVWRLQ